MFGHTSVKLNLLLYSLQLERSEAWWWWRGGRRDCGIHLVNHSPHPSFPSHLLLIPHSPSHPLLIPLSPSSSHLLLIPLSWPFTSSGHLSFSFSFSSSTIPPSHLPSSRFLISPSPNSTSVSHNKTFTLPPHILIILFIPNLREPSPQPYFTLSFFSSRRSSHLIEMYTSLSPILEMGSHLLDLVLPVSTHITTSHTFIIVSISPHLWYINNVLNSLRQ